MSHELLPQTTNNQAELYNARKASGYRHKFNRLAATALAVFGVMIGDTLIETMINPESAVAASISYGDLGYPWQDAPCQFGSAGGSSCTNPNNPGDAYDWGEYVSGGAFQPYRNGYEYRNCTDYVQWKESTVGVSVPGNLGNGGQWYANAPAEERSTLPKAWDAAVVPGNPGHVAFVESVNNNGTITVSEYNHDAQGHGDIRTDKAVNMGFTEFVDFGVHPSVGSATTRAGIVAYEAPGRYMQGSSIGNGTFNWGFSNLNGMAPPTEFEMGNVNSDKRADIVAFEPTSSTIGRFMIGMSNGNGTFDWRYSNLVNMQTPTHFAVGDINGDGLADIVDYEAGNSTHTGRYMQGTGHGDGSFSWGYSNLNSMAQPTGFELGDINGDKKADIVAFEPTSSGGGRYMTGTSNGNGTFNWNFTNLVNMQQPLEFKVGDVTGDSRADIVAFETTGSSAGRFMQGTSAGNGSFNWSYTNLVGMQQPIEFELGDFTGDGLQDIVDYEPTNSAHPGRYMQGSSSGNATYVWGYTNLNSMQQPLSFALGSFTG